MKETFVLLTGLLLAAGLAQAATLYQWTDADGETRFGSRPPPGVVGTIVGEKLRQTGGETAKSAADCRALQDEHLRLIDKEIARLRGVATGVGAEYEFTAEAKQRFINDLLAHRAAFLTGKAPETFAAPDQKRELNELKAKYGKDKAQLEDDLEQQARQIRQEQMELERQRRANALMMQPYRFVPPGWLFY
ncbi:MAG: DUF4124 domain-containing protein [Candidatus Methylumidiphilus sp.]